jgi:hypothetical protein
VTVVIPAPATAGTNDATTACAETACAALGDGIWSPLVCIKGCIGVVIGTLLKCTYSLWTLGTGTSLLGVKNNVRRAPLCLAEQGHDSDVHVFFSRCLEHAAADDLVLVMLAAVVGQESV